MSKARPLLSGLSVQATLLVVLGLWLLSLPSCKHRRMPPPSPQSPVASTVVTEEGTLFYVWDVRLPGASQDLQLRQGGANTWLPLVQVRQIIFTGTELEGFRPAVIFLVTGERTQGDLAVSGLLEGRTDLGSWNIPLRKVRRLTLEHN